MTSSMHVYGSGRSTGLIDRVPVAQSIADRAAEAADAVVARSRAWLAPPAVATLVDLPAPGRWDPPNPSLLLSLTIAPLRLEPPNWAAPKVLVAPWPAPSVPSWHFDDTMVAAVKPTRRRRSRVWAVAITGVVVATTGAVAAFIAAL